ncbi:uncharacterized protein F4822DRAFT_438118 [Hypoxylon trugodes]|uniref:uncharacterized protein n=1 Tax=Hypoxylon trugodes TaxID=326681 RepID=UPI002192EAB8|nr:uncharacterized protein F4822DRAFT_438118 [Hypoxylon trugodes]KAI1385207.1 hypothetical protein F4822DRAFT_438118 [Hypoxylon trugodes]
MAVPGTKEAILNSLLKDARHSRGLQGCVYDLEMPLLLNSDESPLPCRETPTEFEAINPSFSSQIHALFEALHEVEHLSKKEENTENKTDDAYDLIDKDGLVPAIRVIGQSFDRYPNCLHRNFHWRRLSLHGPATLPQLWRVTELRLFPRPDYGVNIDYMNARPVSLRVPLELASRLPALRHLDCPWLWERMPTAFTLRPWRDERHEFGKAVQELHEQLPTSLVSARLWFWKQNTFYTDENQSIEMPDLIRPEDADPLSLALRTLVSHLKQLDLRAFLTPDLFQAPIMWHRMKRLRVEFHPWCPDGTWYFVGPRNENPYPDGGFEVTSEHYPPTGPNELDEEIDEEYEEVEGTEEEELQTDVFRTVPLRSKIEPLLFAFAEALKGMPTLEEAELFTYLAWRPSRERKRAYEGIDEEPYNRNRATYKWSVSYTPGNDGGKRLLTWQVGSWRPQEDVIQSFKGLGGEDREVDILWNPFEFLQKRETEDYKAFY